MTLYKNGAYVHLNYIYNYSSKEHELKAMPILVRYFIVASITFVAWWWVNSWQHSSANQIAFANKSLFCCALKPNTKTKLKKIKLDTNVNMQTM
jgi:hypothetical protein